MNYVSRTGEVDQRCDPSQPKVEGQTVEMKGGNRMEGEQNLYSRGEMAQMTKAGGSGLKGSCFKTWSRQEKVKNLFS